VLPVPVSERQLAEFADKHAWQIPYDTSPRHLAGPGDARHVTHGLAAAGWTRVSDPLSTHLVLTSPDHRHRLRFTPESGYLSTWWHLSSEPFGDEPYWYAAFGELVPAEVLAAVTDALTAPSPAAQPDPWQTLAAAGWALDDNGLARSADGMGTIEHRPGSEFHDAPDWHIQIHEAGSDVYPGRRLWHAHFHQHAPAHLVDAFVTALTDTAPLQRGMHEPTAHYSAVQVPSPRTPRQVVDAHTTRIKAIRARARSARRPQTQPATPPAHTGTAQPAARR
jgi:hypothetical protein